METLVAADYHRNQYSGRSKSRITDHFGSSPSRGFKGINCRTFHSDVAFPQSPPCEHFSRDGHWQTSAYYSEPTKKTGKSKPIPISPSPTSKGTTFTTHFSHSDLWAGPAYSISPPPSSLPIPKFSLRPRRSVSLELPDPKTEVTLQPFLKSASSLELPVPKTEVTLQPFLKSAPSSPAREFTSSLGGSLHNNATATENLRRILNLDMTDD